MTAVFSVFVTTAITQSANAQQSPKRVNSIDKIIVCETIERMMFCQVFDPPGDDAPKDTSGVGSRNSNRCNIEERNIEERSVLIPHS